MKKLLPCLMTMLILAPVSLFADVEIKVKDVICSCSYEPSEFTDEIFKKVHAADIQAIKDDYAAQIKGVRENKEIKDSDKKQELIKELTKEKEKALGTAYYDASEEALFVTCVKYVSNGETPAIDAMPVVATDQTPAGCKKEAKAVEEKYKANKLEMKKFRQWPKVNVANLSCYCEGPDEREDNNSIPVCAITYSDQEKKERRLNAIRFMSKDHCSERMKLLAASFEADEKGEKKISNTDAIRK